jgi:glycine/D-amino acid oxidase-like deaminating enzyme
VPAGVHAEIAIVGGGLTGCLIAYLAARAKRSVLLLEAAGIGGAATTAGPGGMRPTPSARFADLHERYGLRAARAQWEGSRRAALDLASLLRRLRARADLQPTDAVEIARTAEQAAQLEREHAALREAGFEATWLPAARIRSEARADALCGMKTHDAATLDPYRACLAVARAAEKAGALFFERSPVSRVRPGRSSVEIALGPSGEAGTVTCETVVIATGAPPAGFRPLDRHFRAVAEYAAALPPFTPAARRGMGSIVLGRCADLGWHWTHDGRLVVHSTSRGVPGRSAERDVLQRTGDLLYSFSLLFPAMSGMPPERRWAVTTAQAADGVVVAGRHRAYPRHVFALGASDSPASSLLAARIVVRDLLGAPEKTDELFGFGRLR